MGIAHAATKSTDHFQIEEVNEAAALATGVQDRDLSSRVELHVSCFDLRKKMMARCVVYLKRSQDAKWAEVGKTEVIPDTSEPKFVKSIIVDFNFEVQQKIRFEMYNITAPSNKKMSAQEFVGSAEAFLAEIVTGGAAGGDRQPVRRTLEHHQRQGPCGSLLVVADEMSRLKNQCAFTMRGQNLPVMDFFSRAADPYAVINRGLSGGPEGPGGRSLSRSWSTGSVAADKKEEVPEKVPVYRTEVIKRTRSPKWDSIELTVQQLCRGEENRPIVIDVWDWNAATQPDFIGTCSLTYTDLSKAAEAKTSLVLQLRKETSKGTTKARGQIVIENISILRKYSFLDYVFGGLEIATVIAIDFTKSNGDPTQEGTLHYMDTSKPNDYVMAIRAVGEILQHYDSDGKYPVYGFGAKLPPSLNHVSHCFACTGNYFNPEVEGISGIIEAYRRALSVVQLHGPTRFSEVIDLVRSFAAARSNSPNEQKYHILMIVTDGVLNDMQETINAIVAASNTPMSIIIVGVGDEDFALMDELDADDKDLWSTETKTYMSRDIVQFVPFNNFKDRSYHELAMATLEEIPREVVNYFTKHGIAPKILVEDCSRDMQQLMAKRKEEQEAKEEDGGFEMPHFMEVERRKLIASAVVGNVSRDDVEAALLEGIPTKSPEHLLDIVEHCPKGRGGCFAPESQQARSGGQPRQGTGPQRGSLRAMATENWDEPDMPGLPGQVAAGPDGSRSAARARTMDGEAGKKRHAKRKEKEKDKQKPGKEMPKSPNPDEQDELFNVCKVCWEKPIDTVLLECGHQIVCETCSGNIGGLCPLCRQSITRVVKTFGDSSGMKTQILKKEDE
mmetsp:Transcript_32650/g.69019  ORF Transcript_32650/g.69019 Transcript_32650/m.69019 type:complete len:841 (-) Transcript_32650:180-2702(-)